MEDIKAIWAFGLSNPCGLLELAPIPGTRFDLGNGGITFTEAAPEARILFIAGYQTPKSIKKIQDIFQQMPQPKAVVALGTCALSGGTYWDSYNTIKRLTDYVPVDMHVAGCPSAPEAVFAACEQIIERVRG